MKKSYYKMNEFPYLFCLLQEASAKYFRLEDLNLVLCYQKTLLLHGNGIQLTTMEIGNPLMMTQAQELKRHYQ